MAAIDAGAGRAAGAPLPSPSDIVERERATGVRAGLAALLAAVLAVVAGVAPQLIYADAPRVYVIDALKDAAGQDIGREGLATAQLLFNDDKALPLLLVAVAQALSVLLIGYVLLQLLRSALERGSETPKITRLAVLFGAVAVAVPVLGLQIALMVQASDFASSADQSTAAAHDASNYGAKVAASGVWVVGSLALAAGWVLVALAAMRVGLLTRFAGILGVIVGVLFVLGSALAGGSSFVIQAFWLLMVALLLLGRWPGGNPPAWASGEARPWPSQQEVAEARARARVARSGGSARPTAQAEPTGAVAAPTEPVGLPSPAASKKKKRKRR